MLASKQLFNKAFLKIYISLVKQTQKQDLMLDIILNARIFYDDDGRDQKYIY